MCVVYLFRSAAVPRRSWDQHGFINLLVRLSLLSDFSCSLMVLQDVDVFDFDVGLQEDEQAEGEMVQRARNHR